jgi:photosystem II stability/assembly factor-like uncharacterized protein
VPTNWIKWALIGLAVGGLFTSVGPEVANGTPEDAAGAGSTAETVRYFSTPSGALQSRLSSVYCSSTENCLAIGQQYAATTSDFGRTWTSHRILHGGAIAGTMACPTSHVCIAVGSSAEETPKYDSTPQRAVVLRTTDGGRTWRRDPPLPKDVGGLKDISCLTKTYCLTVGTSENASSGVALTTTNLGRSWRRLNLPTRAEPEFVICFTRRACVAAGGTTDGVNENRILTTDNGGSTWTQHSLPGDAYEQGAPEIGGLTCATRIRCFIVGSSYEQLSGEPGDVRYTGFLVTSLDGGRTWTSGAIPTGAQELDEVTCESATDCMAVTGGSYIEALGLFTSSNGGMTWTARSVSPSIYALSDVACPSTTTCMAVGTGRDVDDPLNDRGELAAVAVTHDGGATWTAEWPKLSP